MPHVYTVGHSTQSIDEFLRLVKQHRITAVADVRSVPASRFTPQFNRESIGRSLKAAGIHYVFLGKELGARSKDPAAYVDGVVQYDRLAQSTEFAEGIRRVLDGAAHERIALMCTERDPLDCHRTVLVSRVLAERSVAVDHIHGDGHLESQHEAIERLKAEFGLDQPDLLHSPIELEDEAWSRQEKRIAYVATSRAAER